MDATKVFTLTTFLKAGYSGLLWQTSEEVRAEAEIAAAAEETKRRVLVYSITEGLLDVAKGDKLCGEDPVEALEVISKEKRPLAILRDFHMVLESPTVIRKLRDVLRLLKATGGAVIIVGSVSKIPIELSREITVLPTGLPGPETLGLVLDAVLEGVERNRAIIPGPVDREKILSAAAGLTTHEAENAFALSLVETSKTLPGEAKDTSKKGFVDPAIVTRVKVDSLKKSGILEYYPATESLDSIGGLETLKAWLRKRTKAFTKDATKYGLPAPKGILLAGPPGTGKSLSAKCVSSGWGYPLLRLDVGKVFGSLVGQSEAAMREAIATAEAMAPSILWLDEIEKAFAGAAGGGQYDSGVGSRVFGTFLTWLSEKTSSVFVIATANNVTSLPAELIRKGRFDEIFAVSLPDEEERKKIFEIHIAKRGRKPESFKLDAAVESTEGFSGAELESCVVSSMYDAFEEGREFTTGDVVANVKATIPLSRSMKTTIEAMKAWADTYARPAGKLKESAKTEGRKVSI